MPVPNILIVLGDYNASLGNMATKFPFHDDAKRNRGFPFDPGIEQATTTADT